LFLNIRIKDYFKEQIKEFYLFIFLKIIFESKFRKDINILFEGKMYFIFCLLLLKLKIKFYFKISKLI
jgi:hypothetical protein